MNLALRLARFVKIEHSIFALPFAYLGMLWHARPWPGGQIFLCLTVAMVAVRAFAMGVNRIVDRDVDAQNPRTQGRELVTGAVTLTQAGGFVLLCALVFVVACAGLNRLCVMLAPFALVWSALYSLTKRFTSACHLVLGSVLGLAPVAGWLAVEPLWNPAPVLLGLGVLLWVAGFDILYACQDAEFDRKVGLYSLPALLGVPAALMVARILHAVAVPLFALAGWVAGAGVVYLGAVVVVAGVLAVEHWMVRPEDLSRLPMAFFTLNGWVAVLLLLGAMVDLLLPIGGGMA